MLFKLFCKTYFNGPLPETVALRVSSKVRGDYYDEIYYFYFVVVLFCSFFRREIIHNKPFASFKSQRNGTRF